MNHAKNMYKYHLWANKVLLERIKELPSNVLYKEANSSYPNIAQTFSHIYVVDVMWLQVLKGTGMQEALEASMALLEKTNLYSVDEFIKYFEELASQYEEWMNSQKDLEQKINLNNPWSGARETAYSEILFHVANHGTYHRGNITTMLRQQGHASTMNDLALYWYQS
ncbi:DinB family protein [Bacillus pseudomycoides]|uniref:DinB family protein n=1 Tax=Bacillus pseudomycoides TaxID=64104 RepID=UPI0001A14933|nr:DinB family protein [Bacillus pseudomycoides]EEM07863.1 Nuclease inhibitor [Bacillus pseudomycoides]MED1623111.1 DinB family protein [Bacillus pseudomycoides]PDZ70668.1 damage-inducible protein DinB [Bacillus pseudomycoides]PEF22051.1 damage-inducible protein DinB [Bacillus pseudomycoides]PEO39542.1 damage-inducible protein DinB [Bacillus pseudomycoides]